MCMFTDGSDPDIHSQIAREDAEEVAYRPGHYYLLVKPWGVYVKEAQFFIDEGGLTDDWGRSWQGPVEADSLSDARLMGKTTKNCEHFA